ncbi:MAG: protoporphyrinogen oxidase HemJ [Gammaproteobacteria bacterium]|nr:protoporphyrinogen oxidase HemJ [Gammaproteobacteria bacterium]
MLWVKAFHLIFMVTWFSGLFYLPRLFVYHAMATDTISRERFKVMEAKLYYYITTPGAILTLFFGVWLISYNPQGYMQPLWMHLKLSCVALLVLYHIYLGILLRRFTKDQNHYSHVFYRWLNELPTLFLFAIIILVVVKPF